MRIFCMLTCLLLLAAFNPSQVTVIDADIHATNQRYESLGVTLPPGGIVLPHPYAQPFSSRSLVVPASWFTDYISERTKPAFGINAAALRADLPFLKMVMQRAYAGYDSAAERGWDWDSWFKEWDAALARAGDASLSPNAAFAAWGKLEDFQLDNHSRPFVQGFKSASVSAELNDAPKASCTSLHSATGATYALSQHDAGQQPHAVQAWNGSALSPAWYVSYPERLGIATTITCGGATIRLAMTSQSRLSVPSPYYKSLGGGIGYIRTPQKFYYADDQLLMSQLAKVEGLSSLKVLILDLRSNAGGAAPEQILSHWYSNAQLRAAAHGGTTHTMQSCFTTALLFNAGQDLAASLIPPVTQATKILLQAQVDAIAATPPGMCEVRTMVRSLPVPPVHAFTVARKDVAHTRVLAVVDNHCGSDCDGIALELSRLPDSVIAGTSTAGVMGFSQPGMFVLPFSRVPFMLATALHDPYGDGRSVDGYGVPVDVLLPTAQSQQMASLTALANALAK